MAKLDITAMEEQDGGNICSVRIEPECIKHYESGGTYGPYVILIDLDELAVTARIDGVRNVDYLQVTAIFDPPPYPRLTRWLDSIRRSFIGRMFGCRVETPPGVFLGQRGRRGNLINTKGAN